MRLIDADVLYQKVKMARDAARECGAYEAAIFYDAFCEEVDQMEAVDAVEVVRCKDCKYAVEIEKPYVKNLFVSGAKKCSACRGDSSYGFSESIVNPDDFCNEGERKEQWKDRKD